MRSVEHICGIYAILNKVNNKSYIGESVDIYERWTYHKWALNNRKHVNKHLENAWYKYGENNFEFIVLTTCKPEERQELEIKYIALFKTTNPNIGYNLTGGGEGTAETNEELSKRKSESLKRHYKENPELAKKRFEAVRASVQTPEAREFKRQMMLEKYRDSEYYQKYREKRASKEFREKASKSHKGLHQSEETKRKIGAAFSKPVKCVETGEIFPSCRAASRAMPGNLNIQSAANKIRKTAGGYHWEYVDIA